jgi:hypothetical protein
MSGEDKNLKGVLNEVIGEAQAKPQDSNNTNQSELSNDKSGETDAGGTPEYVAGIDISDIPEQDRPRIKEKLELKAKLLEKGYQPKFQKVAALEKTLDWLQSEGLTVQESEAQLRSYAQQKKNPAQVVGDKKEAVKTLDKLISESDYSQRPALEQMRTIILEETNYKGLQKKIDDLENVLKMVSGSAVTSRQKEINSELDTTFTAKLGKDFVEKYRDKIVDISLKYPNVSISKIIMQETPDEEYEQALLAKSRNGKKPLTQEKLNAISSDGGGRSNAKEEVLQGRTWSESLRQLIKK